MPENKDGIQTKQLTNDVLGEEPLYRLDDGTPIFAPEESPYELYARLAEEQRKQRLVAQKPVKPVTKGRVGRFGRRP